MGLTWEILYRQKADYKQKASRTQPEHIPNTSRRKNTVFDIGKTPIDFYVDKSCEGHFEAYDTPAYQPQKIVKTARHDNLLYILISINAFSFVVCYIFRIFAP